MHIHAETFKKYPYVTDRTADKKWYKIFEQPS